ncbi:arabinan endo-1,5-alpha-L-arabinosidase [Cryobacterium sp. CAN_C3]|uniref:glycoside hydrolase family 43 protein n=1 Tax=unclassified Cryobacterium TaxID=2649013 RepID=UPI0018CB50F4|nr:glycoside hydrolase family 43 protein [Cryobacterium sp. CAN_C3]MEC5155728.1 arabinan endo-1,5-alpha-L-arabinosidase [Cryobacterium sp. CAN_C3]
MTGVARRCIVAPAAAAAVALLAGCALTGTTQPSDGDDTAPDATAPFVLDQDFPDPDVLETGGVYYAYATNGSGFNVQVATSPDLKEWTTKAADALPVLPTWSRPGKTWAPDVSEQAPGRFVMYFTGARTSPQTQCIGVATASQPAGPFTPVGSAPIVCPEDEGGAIDPATFIDDDGSRYLVWKNDGNSRGLDTWLQIARLSDDGTALVGETTRLLKQKQTWEGALIEAPTLVKRDGRYVMFYSANDYGGGAYAIGYATADALRGPYTKADGPLLSSTLANGSYLGPGGQDVVRAPDGSDVLVFHSWDELYIQRGLNVAALTWVGAVPKVTLQR